MLRSVLRILSVGFLAVCSTPAAGFERTRAADPDGPVRTITIHMLPDPASPEYPPYQSWFANHPRVRPARATQLKVQTLERGTLMMAIAGGTAPDILRVYHHEAKAWIRNGFFEKLDKYIYRDTDGDGRYTHGVDEVTWKPFLAIPARTRQFILEDGNIYILPRFQWIQYLIYRKDVLADNGIDPERRIETFDELLHVCRKLTDPDASIPGARVARGRHGFGLWPNGWIWQGWLYACGGQSMYTVKTCPGCDAECRFPQGTLDWHCPTCDRDLADVPGRVRADIDSPAGRRALGLWQEMLWAPFTTCPHCREPVSLGGPHAELTFPVAVECPHCDKAFKLADDEAVIRGCARACVDSDADWQELWFNGEIAFTHYYMTDWIAESNVDPAVVGVMPFPEAGGASAYHYYGIYKGARKRTGAADRVDLCADMVLDFVAQFYVPRDDPHYLVHEKQRARKLVNQGFYNLCTYEELVAAGLEEYASEVPATSREMQRLIRDPNHYTFLPISEGYSRVQQEILGFVLLSEICTNPDYDVAANLAKANRQANTQVFMKDEIVARMIERYRLPFAGALILLAAFVAFMIHRLFLRRREQFGVTRYRRITLGRRAGGLLLLAPAVFLILVWAYYPLVRGSIMAFQDVKVLGESRWVGIENFIRVTTSPLFWTMLEATLIFVFATLSLGFFVPVILAILLSEARRGSTVYRAIYYAPHLLGGVVVLFIWRIFYMPTEEGMLNQLIGYFGFEPVRWLQNPRINKFALAIPGIWAGAGSACLVYLAALKSIDEAMYEAADLDGASALQKVWHVTLPSLKPLLIINFVGAFIGAFHGMGNILVLTGGAYETNVIGLQIFLEAFGYLRFGSSTALAWILGSLLIGFTIYQLSFLRKVEFRRAQ